MGAPAVGFNAYDPVQTNFLSALALGETGTSPTAANEGYGGVNLTGAPTDQFGFPQWSGSSSNGPTSAAGLFQFQHSTWDGIAQEFNLNFQNPQDQEAGAWYLAQQTYANNTGGGSLYDALQSGNYGRVQSALAGVWPSVFGSGGAPMGLAADLSSGTGASLPTPSSATPNSPASGGTGLVGTIENFFVRGGLILAGLVIAVVALWFIIKQGGVAPAARKTVETVKHPIKALG